METSAVYNSTTGQFECLDARKLSSRTTDLESGFQHPVRGGTLRRSTFRGSLQESLLMDADTTKCACHYRNKKCQHFAGGIILILILTFVTLLVGIPLIVQHKLNSSDVPLYVKSVNVSIDKANFQDNITIELGLPGGHLPSVRADEFLLQTYFQPIGYDKDRGDPKMRIELVTIRIQNLDVQSNGCFKSGTYNLTQDDIFVAASLQEIKQVVMDLLMQADQFEVNFMSDISLRPSVWLPFTAHLDRTLPLSHFKKEDRDAFAGFFNSLIATTTASESITTTSESLPS